MRKLLVIPVLLVLAFTGYWFAVARGVEGGLAAWFAERAAEGWVADYGAIGTTGFPLRFETVMRDVVLADPASGLAWEAPRFGITARAFAPNRIVASWPETQTIASPWERIAVASDRFEARVAFVPGPRLELRELGADLRALALASTLGWETAVEVGHLSATAIPGRANAYALRLEATGVTLAADLRRSLDPVRVLPEIVEGLVAEADVAFDAPWDRLALEAARPQPTAIALRSLSAQWGGIALRAAGELTVDAAGIPEGRITVRVENWRELFAVAQNAGLFPAPLVPTLERAFEVLAGLSGPPDTLDAPLTFANGRVSFGPLPLGRAPVLTIR